VRVARRSFFFESGVVRVSLVSAFFWLEVSAALASDRVLVIGGGQAEDLALALRIELAENGTEVASSLAPLGSTPEERAESARASAARSNADFTVWIEERDAGLEVVALDRAGVVHRAPLPSSSPRAFAATAGSLLSDHERVSSSAAPRAEPAADGTGSTSIASSDAPSLPPHDAAMELTNPAPASVAPTAAAMADPVSSSGVRWHGAIELGGSAIHRDSARAVEPAFVFRASLGAILDSVLFRLGAQGGYGLSRTDLDGDVGRMGLSVEGGLEGGGIVEFDSLRLDYTALAFVGTYEHPVRVDELNDSWFFAPMWRTALSTAVNLALGTHLAIRVRLELGGFGRAPNYVEINPYGSLLVGLILS
jgi:hypothetical protein